VMAASTAASDIGLANGRPAWAIREALSKPDSLPDVEPNPSYLVHPPSGLTSHTGDADINDTLVQPARSAELIEQDRGRLVADRRR
jgi:hypothetical protein